MSSCPLEKFQVTVDLIAKNKLNRHNAFDFRIEDLGLILFGNSENPSEIREWMHLSTVVDSLGKLYGYCVDHLYDKTIDLLGGVNRTSSDKEHARTPNLIRKMKSNGTNNLESNESEINIKHIDLQEHFDPYFKNMNKNFDCPNYATMVFNTISVNNSLNLVLSADDPISDENYSAEKAEINLEGLMTFSLNELVCNEICLKLNLISNLIFPIKTSFEEIQQKIDNESIDAKVNDNLMTDALNELHQPISESENEAIDDIYVPNLFGSNENTEERIITRHFQGLENSEKIIRFSDLLENNILKKKKRQRNIGNIREVFETNLAIIRLEEDTEGKNILKRNEGYHQNLNNRNRIENQGYKEFRLISLFTKKVRLFQVERYERANLNEWNPLCVDPNIGLDYSEEQNSTRKLSLNFGLLKDNIWIVLDEAVNPCFLDIVNQLNLKYENVDMINLSIHSCFMGLLHLANEHNLYFENSGECNFIIKKES